jgi:hypothetical protein
MYSEQMNLSKQERVRASRPQPKVAGWLSGAALWSTAAGALLFGALAPLRGIEQKHPAVKKPTFSNSVSPVIRKFCIDCHQGKDAAAGIDLSASLAKGPGDLELWNRVSRNVITGHMPPEGVKHPTTAQRLSLKAAIDGLTVANSGPGHVTLRRLNRAEYNNTVRDLLGVDIHPADNFPSDDVGYGFDNIGDVLSVSPLLAEKYLDAALKLAQTAIPTTQVMTVRKIAADFPKRPSTSELPNGDRMFFSNATVRTNFKVPDGGSYRLRIQARGELAGKESPKMLIAVDRQNLHTFDVGNPKNTIYELPIDLKAGQHEVSISYTNDFYDEATKADRNLVVSYAELSGPIFAQMQRPESYSRVIPYDVERQDWDREGPKLIERFATRAYRRPLTPDELAALVKVFDATLKNGGKFEDGMQAAVAATLISPHFLFRVEPKPNASARPLNDWELASRLSYFLWSTMPDDSLFQLAREGQLHKPEVLDVQVRRMLADPKAHALADNFAEQWLQLRKLANFAPDKAQFPEVDSQLKGDMETETKLFFDAVVQQDRPVLDFLNGRYTFVNERLAKFYGIQGVSGDKFQKVALTDPNRSGILTQASVLCVTSNPTRTSPTKRGKWVLEEILGTPPPPPPPGVGTIVNEKAALTATTLRKLMEEHRKNPTCAACHAQMDPIGFGLENFDAVGHWRTNEGKFPIDSSGVLPSGKGFHGPAELRTILLGGRIQFYRAFTEKLMTYALGRGVEAQDGVTIDMALKREALKGYRFSAVVGAVVHSAPFLKQGA